MERGILITFEGPDGAGKSTQLRLAAASLIKSGREPLCTREPGGTKLSERIRRLLLDPDFTEMRPLTEALLYAAARAQLVGEVILPALEQGRVVLCDRFVDSSLAYQGYGRGLSLAMLKEINAPALQELGAFGTILLDLDPASGLSRVRGEGQPDRLEREALPFHQRVRDGFLALAGASPERIKVIDANAAAEEVQERVWRQMEEFMDGRGLAPFQ